MDILHGWQVHKAGRLGQHRYFLDLPLELRLYIYDLCIEQAEIEGFLIPSTNPIPIPYFTVEKIPLICTQTRDELVQYAARRRNHFQIEGFPQVSALSADMFFLKLPMCAMMLQRLQSVSLYLRRAPCNLGDPPSAPFNSMIRSVLVLEELTRLWTLQCSLRRIELTLASTEEKAYHHVEMQLLAVVNNLAKLRDVRHVKISGPGPFGSDVGAAARRLMLLEQNDQDEGERACYEQCYAEYLRSCQPEDFEAI